MPKPVLNKSMKLVFGGDAFARQDETSDAMFYTRSHLASHLDAREGERSQRRSIGCHPLAIRDLGEGHGCRRAGHLALEERLGTGHGGRDQEDDGRSNGHGISPNRWVIRRK